MVTVDTTHSTILDNVLAKRIDAVLMLADKSVPTLTIQSGRPEAFGVLHNTY